MTLICGFALSYALLAGGAIASPPTSGLLGYWPGNGTAMDQSGNGYDGTVAGTAGYDTTPTPPDRPTTVPIAFRFDGSSNTSVGIPNSSGLDGPQTGSWSISAWVKPTVTPTAQVWIFGQNQGPQLVLKAETDGTYAVLEYNDGTGIFPKVESSALIPTGSWTFIAGTWSMSTKTLQLYVNNATDSATETDLPGSQAGCAWHIGGIAGPDPDTASNESCSYTGQFFTGLIDNVRYYSGALSISDVSSLALQTPGASADDIVTNGSFELPAVASSFASSFDTHGTGSNISGWTVTGDSIDLIEGYWQPYDGAQSVDLDGSAPGGVTQTLSTSPGQAYLLTFAYSRNPDGYAGCELNPATPSMSVAWGGKQVGTYSYVESQQASYSNMNWQTVSVLIDGADTTGSSTTLAFKSTDTSGLCGIALDDVSVAPAPYSPTIATTPTATAAVGATITDSATITGTAPSAAGKITFKAYFNDTACTTTPVDTETVNVNGDGTYTTPGFQPETAGNYTWTATYSGDTNSGTAGVGESCAAGETTDVTATNDTWTRAQEITLTNGAGSASDSIDFSGEPRWYKFKVTPGASVQVNLSNLPANYDLSLFGDIGQEESLLTSSPPDLQELAAETPGISASPYAISPYAISPYAISPYAISPFAISPWAVSPYAISPYAISPFAISPYAISPFAISPYAISGAGTGLTAADYDEAQILSLLAVSENPGTAGQQVFQNVWNPEADQVSSSGPTYFYILVNGNNGAYDPGKAFTVNVQENAGACGNVQPSSAPLFSQSYTGPGSSVDKGTTFKTLILTDQSRLAAYGSTTAMQTDLQTFANLPSVNGTIFDVGANSPQVTALQQQADAQNNVGCPYAENLVASSIRQIVTDVRANDPSLRYIVIVGNDHVIPFFRYSDTAPAESTESGFNPPVLPTSSSFASLQSNDFLSQDAYGSTKVLDINGEELPVPGLPVGRLVNTPSEIDSLLKAYNGLTNGVVPTPSSSLVTGYDFMTKAADAVEDDLCAGLATCATAGPTNATNTTLITNDGVPPTQTGTPPLNSWTAAQLTTALTGTRHDLIFLGGHFNASAALSADFTTAMNASQLVSSNVNLKNSIVFSAGCHSGYNIVPGDAVSGVTQTPDWVEAFAEKQATLIAGSGFQYGDTDFLAYSDQIDADFSHELLQGTGPVAVGSALVQAKEDYLNGVGGSYPNQAGTGVTASDATIPSNAVDSSNLQGIDVKSLLEVTLYGLPMLSVNLPHGRVNQHPGGPSIVNSTTAAPNGPGEALGLSWLDITRTPSLTTLTTQLTSNNGAVTATYLQGPSGVTTSPGAPTLPLDTANVTYPNQVLRGVGFRSGTYGDIHGVTPLTGAPATDLNGVHYLFGSSTFYPDRLATVDYVGGLAAGSNSTELELTPAQYETDAPGSPTDTQRTYTNVGLRLFYSGNTDTPAFAAPPAISRVDASVTTGGSVTFQAHVVGAPLAGIQQVWITYTGVDVPAGSTGEWESLDLTQDQTDPTLWTGTLNGLSSAQIAALQFMVQAVNGVGLVTLDDNQGSYYQPGQIPPALQTAATPLTPTTLALSASAPTSGSYGASVSVSATLTGSGVGALSGQPVSFTIGSSTVDASTNGSGTATTQVPLTNNPGSQYQLTASFAGNSTDASSSTSPAPFTIQKILTTITLGGNGSATVASNGNGNIAATLKSGSPALASYPVAFVFTPTNGTPGAPTVQQGITGITGAASISIGTQLAPGTYSVQAFFGPPGPNLPSDPIFMASSTTGPFTLTVYQALGSGTTACNGLFGGSGGQVTVTAGAVCTLLPGTKLSGNLTVNQGGELNDQGAAIGGNLTATNASWIEVGGGGSIAGNLQVQGLTGAPAGSNDSLCNTKVGGNVVVQSNGAKSPVDIGNLGACAGGGGLTVGGNLQVQSNAGAVTIGGSTVNGNLQVQSNSAAVTVTRNAAKGNVQVQSNTGGGTLTSNSAGGGCTLQSDNPTISGSSNTAGGTNTCNRHA